MLAIFSAIVPVGFIVLVGVVAGRLLQLEVNSLSQVSVYLLAPALVIDGFYRSTLTAKNITLIIAGFGIISLFMAIIVTIAAYFFRIPAEKRKSLMAASVLPNNGNMGLSIASFAFGATGLERAMIYMIGSSILLFGVAPAYLRGKSFLSGIRLIFKLPLLWSIVIGVSFQVFSIELPLQLDKAIESLGQAAIPLALIILGVQLSATKFGIGSIEILGAFLRLVIAPIIAYFVGARLGLSGLDLKILILQSAMPTAVNTVVLVTEFGGDASLMARLVVVTTLASFLSVPVFLWVLR
ncbi:AEC family transporter [Pannus brasiliensis CCIBt3594]|uniref:AEC family transporter n=1 Tax=Pannus brasiliensis CCIBt3594 TaxID=1427578 RepID=A0AAW9QPV2_9CHRO